MDALLEESPPLVDWRIRLKAVLASVTFARLPKSFWKQETHAIFSFHVVFFLEVSKPKSSELDYDRPHSNNSLRAVIKKFYDRLAHHMLFSVRVKIPWSVFG